MCEAWAATFAASPLGAKESDGAGERVEHGPPDPHAEDWPEVTSVLL